MSRPLFAACALFVAACSTPVPPPPAASTPTPTPAPAARQPDDEQLHAQLATLDEAVHREPKNAGVFAARGELNLRLAQLTHARGGNSGLLFTDAVADLRRAQSLGASGRTLQASLAFAYLGAGQTNEAFDTFAVIAPRSRDERLLEGYVTAAAAADQLPAAIRALATNDDAASRFQRGRARCLVAAAALDAPKSSGAAAEFDGARAEFAAAITADPAYRDASEQWIATCAGGKGHAALATGDSAVAEKCLLESARLRPDRVNADLGGGRTVKVGLLTIAHTSMRAVARNEALFRAAFELVPDDVDFANNAAIYARDVGLRLARAGKTEEATAMWERSYATYQRAVALAPHDVRLRNDCALIAIHHLERDWDLTRTMLDGAIHDGETALRDDPPADETTLRDLQEAVGDCFENLALWHLKHGGDAAAAKAAAQRSLGFHPGDRREGAKRHIAAAQQALQRP